MSEHDKILAGRLFDARGTELRGVKRLAHDLCQKYNQTFEGEADTRAALLRQLLGGCGDNVYFQGPIYFNYGFHTTVGRNCFANYQFVVSDDAPVTIGDDCMFGPNVTIVTPFHPLIPEERRGMVNEEGKEFCPCYAKPVVIGSDVWPPGSPSAAASPSGTGPSSAQAAWCSTTYRPGCWRRAIPAASSARSRIKTPLWTCCETAEGKGAAFSDVSSHTRQGADRNGSLDSSAPLAFFGPCMRRGLKRDSGYGRHFYRRWSVLTRGPWIEIGSVPSVYLPFYVASFRDARIEMTIGQHVLGKP